MKKIFLGSLIFTSFLFSDTKVEEVLKIHEKTISAIIDKKVEKKEIQELIKRIEKLESMNYEKEATSKFDSKYDDKFKEYLKERENRK